MSASVVKKNKITSICVHRLTPLDIPVPPPAIFEYAIGYTGDDERYISFYFDEDGKLCYEDAATWDRGNLDPFELWSKIVPWWRAEIENAHIEQPNREGVRNWLLLDRHTRRAYYGPREEIIMILASQRPLPGRAGRPPWERIRADVIIGYTDWYILVLG